MNSTHISSEELYFIQFLSSIILFIIIFITIIGNILVITAVITTPKLQIRPNFLILSLSITDLSVGVFVMPFTAYYDVLKLSDWTFGPVMCDVYYMFIINLTSTSYLHLIVIAIDRYLSVTKIQYSMNKSKSHVMAMIAFSWTFPPLITIWPILGWRDTRVYTDRIRKYVCYAAGNNVLVKYSIISVSLIGFCIIPTLYYRVYKKSIEFTKKCKNRKRVTFQKQKSMDKKDKLMRREFQVAKTLAVVTITNDSFKYDHMVSVSKFHIKSNSIRVNH
ncbi:unnamed protein product [Oppiella nova]|uniref:G-protein coupled receptors family 1 profile domain-containing protein n=1 Tax=Oppiella nova TaxID=334625 RepID=A0A7R9LGH5_9ACAR|nr:unnamed protein product [Oppiella nova]CAG2163396.1 unnamed protein product [Oppiella nova]